MLIVLEVAAGQSEMTSSPGTESITKRHLKDALTRAQGVPVRPYILGQRGLDLESPVVFAQAGALNISGTIRFNVSQIIDSFSLVSYV